MVQLIMTMIMIVVMMMMIIPGQLDLVVPATSGNPSHTLARATGRGIILFVTPSHLIIMIIMIKIILLVATSHPIPAVRVPVSLPGDIGGGEGNGQEEREQKPHLSAGC